MKNTRTITLTLIAFLIGCLAAPLVVPPLTAQNTAAGANRWEVKCVAESAGTMRGLASDMSEVGNQMGAEGWELVSVVEGLMCFHRPL